MLNYLSRYFAVTAVAATCLFPQLHAENKVLFLGNSFTIGGGGSRSVPSIFDALANAAGQDDPTTVMAAVGGRDYQYHYENHQTEIASNQWTHVVMQNYSTQPTHIGDVAEHMTYGALLYGSIMANNPNTQVHLYQTWARSAIHSLITGTSTSNSFESTDEMLDELRTNYQALADSLNTNNPGNPPVKVNPVGDAWNNAGGNLHPSDPNHLDLFGSDEYHGNILGYYLSACVHYAAIYQDDPQGLYGTPEIAALSLGLNASEAAFVEMIAWQTVNDYGLIDVVDDTTPPVWEGLSQTDAFTFTLTFDEAIDTTTATAIQNYTIVNSGEFIAIENIELSPDGLTVTITTATEVTGNTIVEVNGALQDTQGNGHELERKSLQASSAFDQIYIDFGSAGVVTNATDSWNLVELSAATRDAVGNGSGQPQTLLNDLIDATGASTSVSLTLVDAPTGTNNSGTSSGPYPSGATLDSIYGQDGVFSSYIDNSLSVYVFSNLDPSVAYDFTFYASRMSSTDNRETQYQLVGATTATTTLNAANNVSTTAQITALFPNASGEITLSVSPGPNNTNSNSFYYIGALEISPTAGASEPLLFKPVRLGTDFIVDWSGNGDLYYSDDLLEWNLVSPQPSRPFEDEIPDGSSRFYRVEY